MTLLDRFRAQPRQRHPDAAVRIAFVQEIPVGEREVLTEIAREDPDPRVRRAAVAKLMDPAALALVASGDADPSVRDRALAMLRDIALDAFEGVSEGDSLAAVDALVDARVLAAVAKSAASETVANRALERISDSHVLGSIARHADHESVRRLAFDGLRDERELLSVALNSEFREPALTAVDRLTDRADLEQVVSRAKNKAAAKRARAIVREIEEREAQEREGQRREGEAAADAARRESIEVETLRQAEVSQTQTAAQAEAGGQAAGVSEQAEAAEAERKRQQSARDLERQEAAEREAERSRARLAELAEEATRAVAADDLQVARRQFAVIRREWADVSAGGSQRLVGPGQSPEVAEAAARYAEAEAALGTREAAARDEELRVRREALGRLQQLVARVEPLVARDDLTLKAGERALRDVRAALGAMPPLPSKGDYDDVLQRLKVVQAALVPKVQELREVAGWQRWANVGLQERLVEKMEALKNVEDPELIAHEVKNLQLQWRQTSDVPRAQGEVLWRRFKAAHDEVWAKCEAHFAAQAEARADNLKKKLALCERAEALADSTSWIQTAEEIKKLQAEWKGIGPVSRGQEKAIWERFRGACDRFFTRRHTDLAQRKATWSENLAKKEVIIAKVEALADSSDWEPAAAEIRRLQGEWKTIGPVKKTRSEALWQRFRGACDRFFARYAQRFDIARGERVAAREAIVAELELLAADAAPPDLAARVRALRGRWQQELAARGVDREQAAALDARFAAAFNNVITRSPEAFSGSDLDPVANHRRMEAIVKRMEDLASSLAGPADASSEATLSPTTRLAAMLKDALAANTIGGKVDQESRLRAASDELRQAQASWSRIGPVPDEARRALSDRFQRAIRRIADRTSESARTGQSGRVPAAAGRSTRPIQS